MTAASPKQRPPISEDWLATIIGLLIVVVIGSGLLGAGAQNISMSAAAGETALAALRPLSNWQINATLDGERASISDLPTALVGGQRVGIVCHDGEFTIADTLPADVDAPPDGRAQVILINECEGDSNVTYRTSATIPWPLFNLFSR